MDDFIKEKPQLVLIDLQLPAYNGIYWFREIRCVSKVPFLFTNFLKSPDGHGYGDANGADDFVQKPFHMEVLLGKIQAILRRAYDYVEELLEVASFNGAVIVYGRSEITFKDQRISLTKNELFIMRIMLEKVNHIVLRDVLRCKLWDDERFVNDNTLSVNVNRLRMKLEEIGLQDVIVTKKGLSYIVATQGA